MWEGTSRANNRIDVIFFSLRRHRTRKGCPETTSTQNACKPPVLNATLWHICYLQNGEKIRYTLIVREDLSGYPWLQSAEQADSETTADHLMDWFEAFGVERSWFSDPGSNIKNKLVKSFSKKRKANHNYTLPYCPWSNGSVDSVCREFFGICRDLLSEFQLPQSAWHSVTPLIQYALNCTPS